MRQPKPVRQPRVINKQKPFKKAKQRHNHRTYTSEIKQCVVRFYYGDGFDGKPTVTMRQVSKAFNIPFRTVFDIIDQFRKRGRDLCNLRDNRFGKFKMLTEEVQRELTSPLLLQAWARFSLDDRVGLIRHRYGVRISKPTLRRFYAQSKVRFKQLRRIYRASLLREEERDRKRAQFAVRLASLLRAGRSVFFFDESRCDAWQTKRFSWSPLGVNNVVALNTGLHSVSMFAAIGLNKHCIRFYKKCDQENVKLFIPELVQTLVNTRSNTKPVLVLDNHAAHKACSELLEEHFEVCFQAPDSCPFNIVETFWSIVKREFRKCMMIDPMRNRTKAEFDQLVDDVCELVAKKYRKNLWRSNIKYIEKYLLKARELGIDELE